MTAPPRAEEVGPLENRLSEATLLAMRYINNYRIPILEDDAAFIESALADAAKRARVPADFDPSMYDSVHEEVSVHRPAKSYRVERAKPADLEPVAWEFQHEETGLYTTLANDGINNPQNFAANNPRHQFVGPLYRHAACAKPAAVTVTDGEFVDIVFDGPPSHESGRFVEVENASGSSISFGEWLQRPDRYWVLRMTLATAQVGVADEPFLRHIASVCRGTVHFCEPKERKSYEDDTEHCGDLCLNELANIADEIERRLAAAPKPEDAT